MAKEKTPRCAKCKDKKCKGGKDCYKAARRQKDLYKKQGVWKLHKAASAIEARHYCQETRLAEIMLYAKEMKFKKLGLAFCVGMSEEARIVEDILSQEFDVVSVCCKTGGIRKKTFDLETITDDENEVMCNPAGQADLMNRAKTDFNIICGLCVGHDAVFTKLSKAPVTTFIVKDRVLAHNPAGAIYCQYVRRNFESKKKSNK